METQFLVSRQDQLRFRIAHLLNPLGYICFITILMGEFQVALVVARFAFQQAVIESAELFIKVRDQCCKAFAAACFDKCPYH
ncbi:hypothetical protein D3C79_1000190 [compost metagenome]